jgi:DNA uptake protein ComE-like DNA-binding protein
MTAEIFTVNRYRMTVSTNINTASVEEMRTLGISETQAINILNSRSTAGPFENIQQLRDRNLISQTLFNNIQHFISVGNVSRIEFSRPNFRANINLASNAQLTRAGVSAAQANVIIQQRDQMPLRNIQDLINATGVTTNFTFANTIGLFDNLRTHTNLNTAPRSEIESLFANSLTTANLNTTVDAIINARETARIIDLTEFTRLLSAPHLTTPVPTAVIQRILPFVYVDERPEQTVVNFGTATQQQLTDAGIPLAVAQQITRLAGRNSILLPSQIPSFVTEQHRQILTLRTNINTATQEELLSLDASMTPTIVQRIITARADQPFGSLAEVEQFFNNLQLRPMYLRFARVIIVR